ncbi:MAG: VWA domain-containing protein [Cyclobacteriaceae bacterium]|nr:VWA domain-containing protein [Cyclobacteriaceae bacterium]
MKKAFPRFHVRYLTLFVTIAFIVVAPTWSVAQRKVQQKVPERTRILFLLDGSGSMMGIWHNGESRIDVAKRILTRLVDSLRSNENLELALRVYGHRYARQSNNCQDTKLEVPFGTRNHDQIIAKLKEIVPKGVTPITYSLLQAATDFPISPGYRNILILITDGVESCEGDPCATSLELQRRGVFLRPFIIGLGLQGGKALECAGQYFDSGNSTSFNKVLNDAIQTTFSTTSVSVELLDKDGNPDETNIDVSFLNGMTGTPFYEFVHYLDARGRPDTVNIDPVNSYTVVVNTVPPVVRRNVNIVNGKHNVISIPVPQGNLIVKQDGRRAGFQVVVRTTDDHRIINTQMANETFRYLAGTYRIETLTLPRRQFDITIEPDKTRTIELPAPGLVNINTVSPGYGSVFEILGDGTEQWVCHLDPNRAQHSLTLLPGKYKVAFRVRDSGGSKYTGIKVFELSRGQTLNLSVFE